MALIKNVTIAILGKDKTRAAASSSVVNLKRIGAAAKAMGIAMAVAAAAATVAFARQIKKTIDLADETAKLSKKLGVSTEALSTLSFAAQISGASFEALKPAFKGLAQKAVDASRGLKSATDDFDALGVSVENVDGTMKGTEELFLEIATAISEMEDGLEKSGLAAKIFGRQGLELIPLLNEGAEGITKLTDEARSLGIELSAKTAVAAEQFNDTLTRLKTKMLGVFLQIAENMLPALNTFGQAMLNVSSDTKIATIIGDLFNNVLGRMSIAVTAISGELKALSSASSAFAKAMEKGDGLTSAATSALFAYGTAAEAAKIELGALLVNMATAAAFESNLLGVELKIPSLNSEVGGAKKELTDLARTTQSAFSSAGSSIASAAINARDMGEAAKGAGLAAVQMFADMLIQKGLMAAFDTFLKGKAVTEQALITGASVKSGAAVGAAWGPAALATSLASFGANSVPAIAGITATAAALAGATALSSGIGFAGQAHDGIVFPSSGSYLMNVQKGESIVPNLPSGDRGGSSSAPMAVNVMLGTRTLARGIVEAVKGGVLSLKVNSSGHVVAA